MSSVSKARVLVAEDHSLRNTGIAATIERESDMEIIGLSQDGFEAIARFQALRPDVTVVDLRMTNLAGLGLIEAMDFVDEDNRAPPGPPGMFGCGHDVLDLFDSRQHGAEGDKLGMRHARDEPCQRGFPAPRRAPQDHGTDVVLFDLPPQRFPGPE